MWERRCCRQSYADSYDGTIEDDDVDGPLTGGDVVVDTAHRDGQATDVGLLVREDESEDAAVQIWVRLALLEHGLRSPCTNVPRFCDVPQVLSCTTTQVHHEVAGDSGLEVYLDGTVELAAAHVSHTADVFRSEWFTE